MYIRKYTHINLNFFQPHLDMSKSLWGEYVCVHIVNALHPHCKYISSAYQLLLPSFIHICENKVRFIQYTYGKMTYMTNSELQSLCRLQYKKYTTTCLPACGLRAILCPYGCNYRNIKQLYGRLTCIIAPNGKPTWSVFITIHMHTVNRRHIIFACFWLHIPMSRISSQCIITIRVMAITMKMPTIISIIRLIVTTSFSWIS